MLSIFDSRKKLTSFVLTIIFIIYFLLSFLIQIVFRLKHHQISQIFGDDLGRFALEAIGLLFIYAVVVSNRRMPNLSPFNRKLFNFLGNISYPLYLTHASILVLCQKLHITNWALIIACTLLAASLTYWLFDFYNRKRINNGPALVRARQMQARWSAYHTASLSSVLVVNILRFEIRSEQHSRELIRPVYGPQGPLGSGL